VFLDLGVLWVSSAENPGRGLRSECERISMVRSEMVERPEAKRGPTVEVSLDWAL